MTFAAAFPRTFSAPFKPDLAADVVAPSWWQVAGKTCVAAYQPKGAASLAASYVNLANPGTNDAAPGVAPTWASATGWTFNGSTQYLTTGYSPTAINHSMLICFSNHAGAGSWSLLCGQQSNAAVNNLSLGSVFGNQAAYRKGGTIFVSPILSAGVLAVAGNTAYRNGVQDGLLSAPVADTTYSVYIGAENYQNAAIRHGNGNVFAMVIYSATLTAGEVATVSAAMAAL